MIRQGAIVILLLALAAPAWAWTEGTCTNAVSSAGASYQPAAPSGTITTGDLLVVAVSVSKSATAVANLSETGGTGTWTDVVPGSTSYHGGDGKVIVSVGTYSSGMTMPTFSLASSTGFFSVIACAFPGYTGVESESTNTTSASTTVTFSTLTPNESSAEAVFIPVYAVGATSAGVWGTSTVVSSTLTDDMIQEAGPTASQSIIGMFDVNMGPLTPTGTGAPTLVYSGGTAEDNIGITLILTPAPARATMTTADLSQAEPILNVRGVGFITGGTPANIDPGWLYPYTDFWEWSTKWRQIEPNACDEYSLDFADNLLLLAEQYGKKLSMGLNSTYFTPCGIAGSASCSGFTTISAVPAWLVPSGNGGSGTSNTACDNHHTMVLGTDFISSHVFKTGTAVPAASLLYNFDPQSVAYQFAMDRMITDMGHRYGAVHNLAQVIVTGINISTIEWGFNTGADQSTITCNGTGTQCNQISGDADWPGTSQTVALNHIILPTASSNNSACSSNPCVFKATTAGTTSASTQPTWSSCTTTCTDGSVVWTNQGAYGATINDASQYLALTPPSGGSYCVPNGTTIKCQGSGDSTSCTGSGQPFAVCDMERAWEHFENSYHTAFPHALLENPTQTGKDQYVVPEGTITGGTFSTNLNDPFFQDISAHDKATYQGEVREVNASLNYASVPQACQGIAYLANTPTPFVSLGYQTAQQAMSNVAGATCNSGTNNLFSLSATDCLIPCVYEALSLEPISYLELYQADMDSAPDQPWIKLIHDSVWGGSTRGGGAVKPTPISISGFSSQLGNSAAGPATFETGHQ